MKWWDKIRIEISKKLISENYDISEWDADNISCFIWAVRVGHGNFLDNGMILINRTIANVIYSDRESCALVKFSDYRLGPTLRASIIEFHFELSLRNGVVVVTQITPDLLRRRKKFSLGKLKTTINSIIEIIKLEFKNLFK